jgi:Spy/CpxP family protein refolding chaperone
MAARLVARLTTLLNLTSDQQTQAATLFSAEETANASLFASFRTARSALQAAIEKNDADAIATQATQLGSLTTQQTENDAKTQASFYAILTADQQTKYQQLLAAGIAGPGPGFGGPGGPGGHGGPHGR